MKHQGITTVAGISVVLLVGACTNHPPAKVPIEDKVAGYGFTIGEQVKRINNFQINSWSMVDRSNVIIYVGANRRYLVTTRNPCDGLADSEILQYSATAGNLTDKDKLLLRRSPSIDRLESCFIDTLFELEKTSN